MTKLRWRVKLVAECEPGVTTEPELACIERNAQASVADLGLTLAETKRLTTVLQAPIVPTQMVVLGACRQACDAFGRRLAARGHYGATFRGVALPDGGRDGPKLQSVIR